MMNILSKSKRIATLFLLFFFIGCNNAKCQNNLVNNYSFEDYSNCPNASKIIGVAFWGSPTNQQIYMAQYSNLCITNPCCGVPYQSSGYAYQYPRTGDAFADIYMMATYNGNQRNYLLAQLKQTLIVGKYYYAEFFVNLQNDANYAVNNIALLFTDTATKQKNYSYIVANAQVLNYGNPIIKDTLNWVKVSAVYVAHGGEKYITIGNFKSDAQTDTSSINVGNPFATHYGAYEVDDVSVIPLDSMPLKADAGRDTTIHVGDSAFVGSLTNGIDSIKWQVLNTNGTIDSIRPGFWVHPLVNTCYVLSQTVNGFTSSDTVCVSVQTVPLKFISFQVQLEPTPNPSKEGNVKLDLQTANEINVSHFYVQRSTTELSGGKDFIIIHKEQAKNQALNYYSFIDETPNDGVNYYRIVSVDRDGKTSFSETREIRLNQLTDKPINLYPNPAKDVVNIKCKGGFKEMMIFNAFGQQISRQEPRNDATTINIKNFNKGLYVVQVINKNGDVKIGKLLVE